MTIMIETDEGWLLDHGLFTRKAFKVCKTYPSRNNKETGEEKQPILSYQALEDMFAIHTPFMMESQYQAMLSSVKHSETQPEILTEKMAPGKRKVSHI